jgi:hypothetical protein
VRNDLPPQSLRWLVRGHIETDDNRVGGDPS